MSSNFVTRQIIKGLNTKQLRALEEQGGDMNGAETKSKTKADGRTNISP